ncbi:hypothetical protein SRHO_G00162980 [Serrasalmus rhombeus]
MGAFSHTLSNHRPADQFDKSAGPLTLRCSGRWKKSQVTCTLMHGQKTVQTWA